MKMTWLLGTVVMGSVAVTAASAESELQFDVNSLTASAAGAFGTGYTGTVTLADDGNSSLTDILIDGTAQGIAAGQLGSFTGSITIVAGTVTGGSFTITDTSGASYSASIVNGSGTVSSSPGATGPFRIDGLTFSGVFAGLVGGTDFAGVDVTTWSSAEPLTGSFLQFKFGPGAGGVDEDADIDIFVTVPLPTPVGLAGVGLIGLATLRRRR
jgi:hypothetical protein